MSAVSHAVIALAIILLAGAVRAALAWSHGSRLARSASLDRGHVTRLGDDQGRLERHLSLAKGKARWTPVSNVWSTEAAHDNLAQHLALWKGSHDAVALRTVNMDRVVEAAAASARHNAWVDKWHLDEALRSLHLEFRTAVLSRPLAVVCADPHDLGDWRSVLASTPDFDMVVYSQGPAAQLDPGFLRLWWVRIRDACTAPDGPEAEAWRLTLLLELLAHAETSRMRSAGVGGHHAAFWGEHKIVISDERFPRFREPSPLHGWPRKGGVVED